MEWDWILWGAYLLLGIIIEYVAIRTNKYDTLSEKFWKVGHGHWAIRATWALVFGWGFFHIVFGPCAFGIC